MKYVRNKKCIHITQKKSRSRGRNWNPKMYFLSSNNNIIIARQIFAKKCPHYGICSLK